METLFLAHVLSASDSLKDCFMMTLSNLLSEVILCNTWRPVKGQILAPVD